MHSVTSNAVMNKILAVRDYLTVIKSADFWVAFLPSYTIIERRNIGGKRLLLEFGVYQYNTDFYIQISWGTTDAILQQSTGVGRTNFITYDASSAYVDIQEGCKHYYLSLDIPEGSPIVGIQSNADVFFRNLSIL